MEVETPGLAISGRSRRRSSDRGTRSEAFAVAESFVFPPVSRRLQAGLLLLFKGRKIVASRKLAFFYRHFRHRGSAAVARGGAGGAGGGAGGAASHTGGGSSADAGSHQQCWYRWHLQLGFSDWRNCEYTGVQANRNSGAGTAPDVLRSGCLALVSAPP